MSKLETVELKAKILEMEERINLLTTERDVLRKQLVKIGTLGNTEREKLLEQVLKAHPDCYEQIEFNKAFDEASKK